MLKSRIITATLIALFSIGFALEASAATDTTEPCTEENAEQIQREMQEDSDNGGMWDWLWGSKGYF